MNTRSTGAYHRAAKEAAIEGWEEEFDELFTSMAYGKEWRPGFQYTPAEIKAFIRSTLLAQKNELNEEANQALDGILDAARSL